jgi:hypothetical protein
MAGRIALNATNGITENNGVTDCQPILDFSAREESGAVDSFFMLIPILILVTSLFALFRFGLNQNELSSSATLIGRQITRQPNVENLTELTERVISRENLRIADFHVMRYPIGNQLFVQLVLVGEPIRIGWSALTPTARSLTLVDQWQ